MPFSNSPNHFLASLSAHDSELIRPHLYPMELPRGAIFYRAEDIISRLYFPHSGVGSLVVGFDNGQFVEAGMFGRNSVIGVSAALDGAVSATRPDLRSKHCLPRSVPARTNTAVTACSVRSPLQRGARRACWGPQVMKVKRIVSNIAGADPAAAERFYQDVLGLDVLMDQAGSQPMAHISRCRSRSVSLARVVPELPFRTFRSRWTILTPPTKP